MTFLYFVKIFKIILQNFRILQVANGCVNCLIDLKWNWDYKSAINLHRSIQGRLIAQKCLLIKITQFTTFKTSHWIASFPDTRLISLSYSLFKQPPTNIFGDQCPPHVVDPADPNPNALPDCIADCGRLCTGGTGRICGEVYMAPIPGTTDGFAKICTCYCPPQPCVTRGVALVPVVLPNKKAVLTKKILKLTKLGILLAKFCAMYWLKILLCCLYFCLTHSCPSPWKVMDGGWGWGYQWVQNKCKNLAEVKILCTFTHIQTYKICAF